MQGAQQKPSAHAPANGFAPSLVLGSGPNSASFAALGAVPPDVDDPEQVITFMCRKFSGLIDRVQIAEGRYASASASAEALAAQLREVSERRNASRLKFHSAVRAQRQESEWAGHLLREVQTRSDFLSSEYQSARETVSAMDSECEALSARCQSERRSALEATESLARNDEVWAQHDREYSRFRSEVESHRAQLATLEEELVLAREGEQRRRQESRSLESKLSDACQARLAAERRAESQHEEVCGALRKLTLYRERLDVARHTLQRREEDVHCQEEQLAALRAESHRRAQESSSVAQGLAQLEETKVSLETALRENVEAHGLAKAAAEIRRKKGEAHAAIETAHHDVMSKLDASSERLSAAEADINRLRQRLSALGHSTEQTRIRSEALEMESRGVGAAGSTLQKELQAAFADTERLRQECDDGIAACDEMQRRLRITEPALENARRRALELEEAVEDKNAECGRIARRKEGLVRDVSQFRDKMRGLRKRNVALTEKAQTLEKRLMRGSGAVGPAGFAAAAAEVARAPATSSPVCMPSALALPQTQTSEDERPGEGLGYLRQWVELEEARLGKARTPPKPLPSPCMSAGQRLSSSEPRSAAALAALAAGANPAEAVALLDGDA